MSIPRFANTWTIRGPGGERLLLQAAHEPVPARYEVLPPFLALIHVRHLLFDADQRRAVIEAYLSLTNHNDAQFWSDQVVDSRIEQTLRSAVEHGELRVIVERPADTEFRQHPASAQPPPPAGPKEPREQRSFYEIVVLDELETPIADLRMTLSTPAGTITRPTDASGRVRVDDVPGGFGSARVTALVELAAVLAGRERRPRRTTPLPEGEPWHLRTPAQLGDAIILPDGEPQKLMIIARTEIRHIANTRPWADVSLLDGAPCALDAGDHLTLQLCSNAQSAEAILQGPSPPAPLPAPPTIPPLPLDQRLWISPNVYVVQAGDTLMLIAARYLGDSARWREIRALNEDRYPSRSPDSIFPGDTFVMPTEAVPGWVSLPKLPPPPPEPPPPAQTTVPEWLRVGIDAIHGALFQGDFAAVWAFLESVSLGQPAQAPSQDMPPYREELAFRAAMVELALEGRVDPPIQDTKQV